jgi:hypothetical protein
MGFLEAAVVVYLRQLYYANGFGFPLNAFMEPNILLVEVIREISTIIMLLGIGYLATDRFKDRFAYFLLVFAVWDIFYYVWLKVTLNWPDSILTYDLLFLIPWPWVGPVLAPVIASLTMILLTFCLLNSGKNLQKADWALLSVGASIMLYTFLSDYGKLIAAENHFIDLLSFSSNPALQAALSSFVPGNYNWTLFIVGEILILTGIYLFRRRTGQK